jgi:hypothetical protein
MRKSCERVLNTALLTQDTQNIFVVASTCIGALDVQNFLSNLFRSFEEVAQSKIFLRYRQSVEKFQGKLRESESLAQSAKEDEKLGRIATIVAANAEIRSEVRSRIMETRPYAACFIASDNSLFWSSRAPNWKSKAPVDIFLLCE